VVTAPTPQTTAGLRIAPRAVNSSSEVLTAETRAVATRASGCRGSTSTFDLLRGAAGRTPTAW
jgi:hypothetical protein